MQGLAQQPGQQRDKGHADQGNAAARDQLGDATAFYGYINLADEEAAHAQFGAHVWLINTDQYYALVSPSGTVIFVGNHDVSGINQQSRE